MFQIIHKHNKKIHVKRIPLQNGIAKTDKRVLNAKFHYAIHVNASCSATCERHGWRIAICPIRCYPAP